MAKELKQLKSETYLNQTVRFDKYPNGLVEGKIEKYGLYSGLHKTKKEAFDTIISMTNLYNAKRNPVETIIKKYKNLFKTKRIFYFKEDDRKYSRMYGSATVTTAIYEHTPNGMKRIGEVKWNTASTPGVESEVYQELIRLNILPKEFFHLSVSSWSGSGYYPNREIVEKLNFEIRELR